MKKLTLISVFAAALLAAPTGRLDSPLQIGAVCEAQREGPSARRRGFMLNLDLGVGGCSDRLCHDVMVNVDLRLGALFRFMDYYGVGLHMAFLFGQPRDTTRDYLDALRDSPQEFDAFWTLVVAPEFRLFLPMGDWELWAGLVPGYARWMAHGDFYDPNRGFDASMDGFVFGWGVGGDYYVHPNVGLGLTFHMYHPIFDSVCDEVGNNQECRDIGDWERHDVGLWWSFAFRVTAFLPI
jgi:hypothetical protein